MSFLRFAVLVAMLATLLLGATGVAAFAEVDHHGMQSSLAHDHHSDHHGHRHPSHDLYQHAGEHGHQHHGSEHA